MLALNIDAFVTPTLPRQASLSPSVVATRAFWRHWIPETDRFLGDDTTNNNTDGTDDLVEENAKTVFFGSILAAVFLLMTPQVTVAVSGGGLDFAGLDVSGKDYSNSNYKGKDFTQVIAKGTTFAKSNLQGCRFYKAYLVNTDFSGADIRGASLEDTSMDGANLKDAVAVGSYFSKSILDTASVENADFTDAQFPMKTLALLCDREDMKGTNPLTGADTRESAMCP